MLEKDRDGAHAADGPSPACLRGRKCRQVGSEGDQRKPGGRASPAGLALLANSACRVLSAHHLLQEVPHPCPGSETIPPG